MYFKIPITTKYSFAFHDIIIFFEMFLFDKKNENKCDLRLRSSDHRKVDTIRNGETWNTKKGAKKSIRYNTHL